MRNGEGREQGQAVFLADSNMAINYWSMDTHSYKSKYHSGLERQLSYNYSVVGVPSSNPAPGRFF